SSSIVILACFSTSKFFLFISINISSLSFNALMFNFIFPIYCHLLSVCYVSSIPQFAINDNNKFSTIWFLLSIFWCLLSFLGNLRTFVWGTSVRVRQVY